MKMQKVNHAHIHQNLERTIQKVKACKGQGKSLN